MADIVSKEKRSWVMSQVPSRDTKAEIAVRSLLHKKGFRFRLHRKDLPGCPDIVLKKYKVCIFVNGCFWHQHKGCKKSAIPKSNVDFWVKKFEKNVKRDQENYNKLRDLGWNVLLIWECEIKNVENLDKKLTDFFDSLRK